MAAPGASTVGGGDFFNSYFENAIAGLPTDSATPADGAEASFVLCSPSLSCLSLTLFLPLYSPQEAVVANPTPTEPPAVAPTPSAVDNAAQPTPSAEPAATTVTSLSPESLSSLTGG